MNQHSVVGAASTGPRRQRSIKQGPVGEISHGAIRERFPVESLKTPAWRTCPQISPGGLLNRGRTPPPHPPPLSPSVILFVSQRSANFALGCNFGWRGGGGGGSPCLHNPVSRATVVMRRQAAAPPGVNSPSDVVQMKCFCSHSNAISSLATSARIKVSAGSAAINTRRGLLGAGRKYAKLL